ncbi:1215_t:CDS:2 [Acaulospora morrowiae]|uniref:1215_t:CDS:1 n=1 Tax=Acaulospora morrowiae TaxID=94023 RepID=A0A9N9A5I0_9GLOM|nr:1215_t:CDS:2 [Acaulospora morrowiae]
MSQFSSRDEYYSSSDSLPSSDSEEECGESNEITNWLSKNPEDVLDCPHYLSRHRKYEKWMLPVINARRVMTIFADTCNWSSLLNSIQKFESALKTKSRSNDKSLDIFTPVLARFLIDLDEFIKRIPRDKKYKKNLNSTEARACTIVQQKSVQLLETWDSVIRKYSDSPPSVRILFKEKAIIDALEIFLMIPPHNFLSLRNLNIEAYPQSLKKIHTILDYYYSFSNIKDITTKIGFDSLTALDLSKNRLRDLPHEIFFFKNLKILDISYNLFQYLPPLIAKFVSRSVILRVERNPFRKSNTHRIQKLVADESTINTSRDLVPRLTDICAQNIILNKILITRKRKFQKFIENDQSKRITKQRNISQSIPDVLVDFVKQGYLLYGLRMELWQLSGNKKIDPVNKKVL